MKLVDLAEIRMGYPFRSRLEHDPAGNVAVIQMKDIDDANLLHAEDAIRVSLPAGKGHHLIQEGDLVFRSRGRSNAVALVAARIENAVLAAPMLLIHPRAVLPAYLHWFINTPATQTRLAALAEGTSVRMISAESLKELDVPLPSEACQRRIVELATLAQQEQTLIANIATQRKKLMEGILMERAIKEAK